MGRALACLTLLSLGQVPAAIKATLCELLADHAFELEGVPVPGLSAELKLALRLYSAEQPQPTPLYRVLNSPFHASDRSLALFANQAPFLRLLLQATRRLSALGAPYAYDGPAFRGVRVQGSADLQRRYDNYQEAFPVGGRLTFAAFTSVSLEDSEAAKFAGGAASHALYYTFTRVRGVRIAGLSALPNEAEVLLEPPAVFTILQRQKLHGVVTVVLEAVELSDSWRYLT